MPVMNFIARLIRHIPDRNFKMIRYYGFLSNRTRGEKLPLVYIGTDVGNAVLAQIPFICLKVVVTMNATETF